MQNNKARIKLIDALRLMELTTSEDARQPFDLEYYTKAGNIILYKGAEIAAKVNTNHIKRGDGTPKPKSHRLNSLRTIKTPEDDIASIIIWQLKSINGIRIEL